MLRRSKTTLPQGGEARSGAAAAGDQVANLALIITARARR
jgi:hypothetical protein